MKPILIIVCLGLQLLLTGCQSTAQSKDTAPSTAPPLYTLLTDEDIEQADKALQYSLETLSSSQQRNWSNPQSGNSGMVMPLRTYKSVAGYYCREYREQIKVKDRSKIYFDTACRNKKGKWYPI